VFPHAGKTTERGRTERLDHHEFHVRFVGVPIHKLDKEVSASFEANEIEKRKYNIQWFM
jgi:hypothetical protein